jgi:catechol-2,3-dioxygenase
MNASLSRIILYVQDVGLLTRFYRDILGLPVVQEIGDEWVIFRPGSCELALHRVDRPYRVADAGSWTVETNVKLVLVVAREIAELRAELISKGVPMREVKSYPGFPGPLCDGEDPEGNIFQLQQG